MAEQVVTSAAVMRALNLRYQMPEWLFEPECTLGMRRIDAVAFNMWGARSHRVLGFEVKVSRGDWLRELKSWEKSGEWERVVDEFIVVAPAKMIAVDEIPAGWGLLELSGTSLRIKVRPKASKTGETLPRELFARLTTRTFQQIAHDERSLAHQKRIWKAESVAEITREVENGWKERLKCAVEESSVDANRYRTLEAAMGVGLLRYASPENGRALKALRIAREIESRLDRGIESPIDHAGKMMDREIAGLQERRDRLTQLGEELRAMARELLPDETQTQGVEAFA
jgi:hypothetical protein